MSEKSKLAQIRIEKGLYQKDVAQAAGVTRAFYTQVENGSRVPSIAVAKLMADVLGMTLDEFFRVLEVPDRNLPEAATQ